MKQAVRILIRKLAANDVFRSAITPLSRSGLIPPRIARILPAEGECTIPVVGGKSFQYHSSHGDVIGRALYWRGGRGLEPETFAFLEPYLAKAKTFIDVGANTGQFSLYACTFNPSIAVHAFEPVEETFQVFQKNIASNNFGARCHAHQMAVGETNGTVKLHIPHDTRTVSASLNPDGFRGHAGELKDVEITTLDRYFAAHDLKPDILKIDVEGFEHQVLGGMKDYFASGARPLIVFECHPEGPAEEITKILKPLSYTLYHLTLKGPIRYDTIHFKNGASHEWNWAAVPA